MKLSKFSRSISLYICGVALMLFCLSYINMNMPPTMSAADGEVFIHYADSTAKVANRKLQEHGYNFQKYKKSDHESGKADLEDYNPIDPVPSSKHSVGYAPIYHGSPLIPYIPQPSPPNPPNNGK